MQPRLTIQHPKGPITLSVTHPLGLVPDFDARREDYCVVFITPTRAKAIYDAMAVGPSPKMDYIVDNHFGVHVYEVPLAARASADYPFEIRNDAHVLGALVAAGVESVPVVVHVDDAGNIRG